tara:strand:+ start:23030 stop:23731 length:702 start_codon:yes stop_codon:yes gene_type:complete
MMKNILILIGLLISSMAIAAGRGDDPLLAKVMIDQFELRNTAGPDPVVLQGQAWIGKDLDKFWVKADAERVSGKTEELELQFLYSTAIAPYWDAQIGWRHDKLLGPKRDWLAFGFQGLAPYFFEIDAAVFIGEGGQTAIRFEAEYEILLTQKLILSPDFEVNLHGKDDVETGVGAGLSDVELGLRLRYEITREFAPYIGINWTSMYGKTADIAKLAGEDKTDTQFVVGVRAWF